MVLDGIYVNFSTLYHYGAVQFFDLRIYIFPLIFKKKKIFPQTCKVIVYSLFYLDEKQFYRSYYSLKCMLFKVRF